MISILFLRLFVSSGCPVFRIFGISVSRLEKRTYIAFHQIRNFWKTSR